MTKHEEDLSVSEALRLVLAQIHALEPESVPLSDALGRITAAPIVAGDDLPPFANSSMDGYAVRSADVAVASRDRPVTLRVLADISAGSDIAVEIVAGTAARIMTGAPLPGGADAIVPVEDSDEPWRGQDRPLPLTVSIFKSVDVGSYVRYPGEDIRAGMTVLQSGHVLRPQEIGVLASLGISNVSVVRRPRVGVLSTGDELVDVEVPLSTGKIRNSNSYTQAAQVRTLGGIPVVLGVARDSRVEIQAKLDLAVAEKVDLLISSAGVSVGAYDLVKEVLNESGDIAFWRVRMRPGKPLAFGTCDNIPFLGLPGNPVSAMVSFEIFARPAILKLGGYTDLGRPRVQATVLEDVHSDGRETYLRAVVTRDERGYVALTTGSQGSHILMSLVKANALLIIPEGVTDVAAGTPLTALMLDWSGRIF